MDISIQAVQDTDLAEAGRLMTAYKISSSINRLLWKVWPSEPRQQEQTLDAVTKSFNDKAARLWKAVDHKTGEMVGFVVVTRKTPPPTTTTTSPPEAESQSSSTDAIEVPDRFVPEVFTTVIKAMGDIGKETDHLDHLEISAIVVRQDRYRNGIGSQLMSIPFDMARADNIPIVMRAEPASYAFFKKHGFQDTKTVDFDLAAWAEPYSGFGVFRVAGMAWYP